MALSGRGFGGRACLLCPTFSDVDLFRYGKRIIDLNPEITDCALDFGVAEQELNCSKVSRFLVD
jgi:hypothetical protein